MPSDHLCRSIKAAGKWKLWRLPGQLTAPRNPKQKGRVASPLSGRVQPDAGYVVVDAKLTSRVWSAKMTLIQRPTRPDFLMSRRLSATCSPSLLRGAADRQMSDRGGHFSKLLIDIDCAERDFSAMFTAVAKQDKDKYKLP